MTTGKEAALLMKAALDVVTGNTITFQVGTNLEKVFGELISGPFNQERAGNFSRDISALQNQPCRILGVEFPHIQAARLAVNEFNLRHTRCVFLSDEDAIAALRECAAK